MAVPPNDVIDWHEAMQQCGDDEEFLRELLVDLRTETEQQLAPIPESIAAGEELGLEELEFYPVPTNAKVQLRFKTKPEPVSVNVYDQNGRSIYAEDVKGFDGYYQGEIDLSGNPSGTYFLQINQQGRVHIERLILQE